MMREPRLHYIPDEGSTAPILPRGFRATGGISHGQNKMLLRLDG